MSGSVRGGLCHQIGLLFSLYMLLLCGCLYIRIARTTVKKASGFLFLSIGLARTVFSGALVGLFGALRDALDVLFLCCVFSGYAMKFLLTRHRSRFSVKVSNTPYRLFFLLW